MRTGGGVVGHLSSLSVAEIASRADGRGPTSGFLLLRRTPSLWSLGGGCKRSSLKEKIVALKMQFVVAFILRIIYCSYLLISYY